METNLPAQAEFSSSINIEDDSGREFANMLPIGMIVFRKEDDNEIIFANKHIISLFGYENYHAFKESAGKSMQGLIAPNDFQRMSKDIYQVLTTEKAETYETFFNGITKDGRCIRLKGITHNYHSDQYGELYMSFIQDFSKMHETNEENIKKAEIIDGLSHGLNSVYLVDFKEDSIDPFRIGNAVANSMVPLINGGSSYHDIIKAFCDRYVVEEEQQDFLDHHTPAYVQERLKKESRFSMQYHRYSEVGKIEVIELSFAPVEDEYRSTRAVFTIRTVK